VEIFLTSNKGFGLRSLTRLPSNQLVGEYLGEVILNSSQRHPVKREDRRYDMDGHLPPDHPLYYVIRSEHYGNYTRYTNHSCEPNTKSFVCRRGKEAFIGIVTIANIALGEELTIDYGNIYWRGQKCQCLTKNCRFGS